MKTIKMMLLLTAVYICTSIFSSAYAEKECSKFSILNPCPIFGGSSESSKSTAAERKVTKKVKEQSAWSKWSEKCSNLVDCLKKD